MRNSYKHSILIIFLFLASCTTSNSNNNNGNNGNNNQTGLSQAQAEKLAPTLLENITFLTKSFGDPNGFLDVFSGLNLLDLQQNDKCITLSKISTITTLAFNCSISIGKLELSLLGIVVLQELSNGLRTFTQPTLNWIFSNGNKEVNLTFDFDIAATKSGNTYTVDLDYKLTSTGSKAFTANYLLRKATFVSNGGKDPFSSGTLTFDGQVSYSDNNDNFILGVKTDPNLVISSSCNETPIAGAVLYTLNNDRLQISFNGCDSYSASLNGKAIVIASQTTAQVGANLKPSPKEVVPHRCKSNGHLEAHIFFCIGA